ncbi:L-ascorbate metabolism protein UlaG, beta-lactamase superfamily [Thermomonospora echinospora]|uniref:L-ascorbate metabolism protein UlaG, beta-lactamase superfamily n=1 Tax=Thermomonospora echinospora TaxID=1992 RepID=A0A1H5ZZD6_9ACTN|nr:MBL fold metallo-hydrolase [Thermomonospora echinospora]SEG40826.1 L-ascorbate metabolism protein UlaG, beta-lactamase superfamily [Thermomonospora echinospora]
MADVPVPGGSGPAITRDAVTFVGNATVIIHYGAFTLLTDPNFVPRGHRVHLGYGIVTTRLKDPALAVEDLPELDAVVLSHLHGDHWDGVAERHLDRSLPIVTTQAAARALRRRGFGEADGLEIWRHRTLTKGDRWVRITALPGRHGPDPVHLLLPPVIGTLLEFGTGGSTDLRLYQSGDTVMYDQIAEVRHRYPDIDLGIVHLGGTRPLNLVTVTMDGRQGADWVETVQPDRVMPVHYDDYSVMKSPLSDFEAELRRRGLSDRMIPVERGGSIPLTRVR